MRIRFSRIAVIIPASIFVALAIYSLPQAVTPTEASFFSFCSNFTELSFISLRALSIFLSGTFLILLYYALRRFFRPISATLAISLIAFNPLFISLSARLSSFMLILLFFSLCLFLYLLSIEIKLRFKPQASSKDAIQLPPVAIVSLVILSVLSTVFSTIQNLHLETPLRSVLSSIYQNSAKQTDHLCISQELGPVFNLEYSIVLQSLRTEPKTISTFQDPQDCLHSPSLKTQDQQVSTSTNFWLISKTKAVPELTPLRPVTKYQVGEYTATLFSDTL